MEYKSKHSSILGLFMVLAAIAAGVAAIVYACMIHRRHVDDEKWRDYDECGFELLIGI